MVKQSFYKDKTSFLLEIYKKFEVIFLEFIAKRSHKIFIVYLEVYYMVKICYK